MQFGAFTIALVVITVLISLAAFSDGKLMDRLILWPSHMRRPGEYYRLLSSGFVHLDATHLIFNMFPLFYMGNVVEHAFLLEARSSEWLYILMYLTGIIMASLPSFLKNRNNPYYRSLGASGGVAAVIFCLIYFDPWAVFQLFFTVKVYAIVFGALYLMLSAYLARRSKSNVNHDAHFWGAVYGFLFAMLAEGNLQAFIQRITTTPF